MSDLCADIASRCEELAHVKMEKVLVSFTPCRNRRRSGLQARVTPLRFSDGALSRRQASVEYHVQRFFVNDVEVLYLLTFCLPRFLEQSFDQKLLTVFHELYHISPAFGGDLRRYSGRYTVHSHSRDRYDSRMADLVQLYLANHPEPVIFDFLQHGYQELCARYGGVHGIVVPRPKLLPAGKAALRTASRKDD